MSNNIYDESGWPVGFEPVETINGNKIMLPPCGCSGPCDLPECDGFGNISTGSLDKQFWDPAEQAKVKALPTYKIRWAPKLNRVSHIIQGKEGVRIYMKSGRVIKHSYL